jgi:hypothetical protein
VVERAVVLISESIVVLPGHVVVAGAVVEIPGFKIRNSYVNVNFLLAWEKNSTSLAAKYKWLLILLISTFLVLKLLLTVIVMFLLPPGSPPCGIEAIPTNERPTGSSQTSKLSGTT